ncbi:hypothetical protein Mapa_000860 [Marchantia paleacea]|nr:hypothetical protein Mapa_000860 [Marchantia paleacea]
MAAAGSLLSVALTAGATGLTKGAGSSIAARSYAGVVPTAQQKLSGRAGAARSNANNGWIPMAKLQSSDEKKMAGLTNGWNSLTDRSIHTKMQAKGDVTDVESEGGLSEPLVPSGDYDRSWTYQSVVPPFLFPALGGLLFGYDIGATSGSVLSLTSPDVSGTTWFNLSSIETGLVVSGSLYGALLGSILAFNVADSLGRRRELIVAAITYAVGAAVTGLAPNLPILITGRLIYGIAIGLAMHAAPCYISETAPTDIRGTLISLKEALIVLGILLGYLVGSLEISTVGGWRVMFGAAVPMAALMGLGVFWLPPSPRWLLLRAVQGKTNLADAKSQALNALSRLRGVKRGQDGIDAELAETLTSVENGAGGSEETTFGELFQGNLNQKALLIGGGLVFLQQVTGQPSVLYYAAPILQSAGFSAAADATNVSVLLGFFKLFMTCVAVVYVDKVGRRPLLIGGVTGIVASLLLLSAYYSFASGVPALAVGALLLYVGSYQVSFGPISWLMVSEVFPLRTRGKALSLTTLINFASNAVVAFSFAPIQDLIGVSATFLLFGLIGVGAFFFVLLKVPETKGLSLEQIETKLSE